MALASCKHIAKSPSASLPDRFSDEGRITFLERDYFERRRKSKGSRVAPDHAVKAPLSHSSAYLQAVSVGESISSERAQIRSDIECVEAEDSHVNFLTELNRSQLESQWACAEEAHHKKKSHEQGSFNVRLSARQRRILSRRRENGNWSAVQCLPFDRHVESFSPPSVIGMEPQCNMDAVSTCPPPLDLDTGKIRLPRSLGTVSTIGFMRGRANKELLTKDEEAQLSKKMKMGQNLRAVKKRLAKSLGYEPSEESVALCVKLSCRELQARLLEADQARDYMFLANLRLVVSVAKRYSSLGINLADLTQEGAAGLLRGLEKFDYTKGFKLSTYVHWWIRQGVTQALGQHSKTVRIPPYMYAKLTLIIRTMAKFREDGVPISVRSLSTALNMPEEIVSVALKATKKIVSLDKPKYWHDLSPDGDSMHNYVADPCFENNPWSIIDNMFLREHLDVLITSTLCKREQDIVRLYYGFEGQGISYHRIGLRLGLSRERVRQLENRALRKLVVAGRKMDLGVSLAC
ncbi:hypothetical protein GOP47_0015295 [Adiantum capillus-veneris]|uniref:Sigma factor n=1 Tax=Adiantum capillus-veneris TaxID=13818 RepID=A0A9D4ZBJ1_ADICA|nr:hypothetical protein GOP47_0015295 [Adiantum capillus-veneris]